MLDVEVFTSFEGLRGGNMDGPGQVADAIAPVTVTGVVVATVPATGLSITTTIALAVFVGLLVWGLIYLYRMRNKGSVDQ